MITTGCCMTGACQSCWSTRPSTSSASPGSPPTTWWPASRRSATCPPWAIPASAPSWARPTTAPAPRRLSARAAEGGRAGRTVAVEHALFSIEGGHAAGTRLIEAGVTGIICASDQLALGAVRAARRAGLAVPDQLSVVGFDDSALMTCTAPPLTTVRQPIEAMGRAVVAMLVNQIEGVPVAPEELLFEPELVVRGSTARVALRLAGEQPRPQPRA